MANYFTRVGVGSVDIVKGLWVTFKCMFTPPVTVQYPREKLAPAARFRGTLRLTKREDGTLKCIMCQSCVKVCPVQCITIESAKDAQGKRQLQRFDIDTGRCCYCGLCVNSCPVEGKAIVHSAEYERVAYSRAELVLNKDLLQDG